MAKQWQQLSLYARLAHGYRMNIQGTMAQHTACTDKGHPDQFQESCDGAFFTAAESWQALFDELNADSRTAQSLPYVTDIRWNFSAN